MIDIHSHLIDDLEVHVEDIMKTLKKARRRGIKTIVFTPHINHFTKEEIKSKRYEERFNEILDIVTSEKIDIELHLGVELEAYKGIDDDLRNCQCSLVKSKYIILNVKNYANSVDELVYSLVTMGFKPIITNAETKDSRHGLYKKVDKWRQSGALVLLHANNIFGFSHEAKQARSLLRHRLVDYIGTGCVSKKTNFAHILLARFYIFTHFGPKQCKKIFYNNTLPLLD